MKADLMVPIFFFFLKKKLVTFCRTVQLDFHLIYCLLYFLLYHQVSPLLIVLNISLF